MIVVDTSVIVDLLTDQGSRGNAAAIALSAHEVLVAPGHAGLEVLSSLHAVARRPGSLFTLAQIEPALHRLADLAIRLVGPEWAEVQRAWDLRGSLRYADALFVAAAERRGATLLTADAKLARSGAHVRCEIAVVGA